MILTELYKLYQRLAEDPDGIVPQRGWSNAKVSWELVIDENGALRSVIPLSSGVGRAARDYVMLRVPQHDTRTSGIKPFFLCDSADYLLGWGEGRKVSERHAESVGLHSDVLGDCADVAARAVLLFLSQSQPSLTSFGPESQGIVAGGFAALRLEGDARYVHERPAIVEAWESYLQSTDDARVGQCAVTGQETHLARLYPQVTGLPGAQSSGASLVSFNKPSFESYGAKQTYNASISEDAAFGSGEALRYLFRDPLHHVNMGGTQIVFWADRPAPRADLLILQLLGGTPAAEDGSTVEMINAAFADMRAGRSLVAFDPQTRYFILGISPNAARLAVRFFYTDTLGSISSNYGQYLRDIGMVGQDQASLGMLLRQTAALGKRENVPSTLVAPCFAAMLRGGRFPESLLATLLSRMRADHASNSAWDMGQRASLIKACLVRSWRHGGKEDRKGELTMALNRENDNVGYLLGRLFAVMERAQSGGIGDTNATIRDRYIGAAASTPARVFPQLFHGLQNSLTAARKRNMGLSVILERELDEIVGEKLSGGEALPTTLDLEDQGEFYIGYYQERTDLWKSKKQRDAAAVEAEA